MKKKFAFLLSLLVLSSCSIGFPSFNGSFNTSSIDNTSENSSSVEQESSSSKGDSSVSSSSSSSSKPSSSSSSKPTTSSSSSKPSSSSSSSSSSETTSEKLYAATYENKTPDGYYESCRGKKGAELKKALHDIIDDHTEYTYGSEINSYMKVMDEDINDSSKMHFIYTGVTSKSTSFNKEHVWAKSHGGFDTSKPAGSDLHNLRPCIEWVNSKRGSLDFDMGGELLSNYNGNNRVGSTFEPSDFSKGDVARTIFYMAVRYEGDGEPQLEVESPTNKNKYYDYSSGATGVHGNFDALYDWATSGIDPVDDQEVKRNNIIYEKYQHNRNPFIDHPEFIIMIYDKEYNGEGALKDLNPFENKVDPQEEKAEFEKLVTAIGNDIDENSYAKIQEAKDYYDKMSKEGKDLSKTSYEKLQSIIEQYEQYMEEYGVQITIDLINAIGEVTLDSKNAIEAAEKAYNDLSSEQKSKVTNYQTLVDARTTFDKIYSEWLEEQKEKSFEIAFGSIEGASSSYSSNVTLTSGDKKLIASYCYKQGTEFRLGNNSSCQGDEQVISSLGISSNSASLKTLFTFKGTKITLTSTKKYGTVSNLYFMYSLDGASWSKISSFDGDFSSTRTFEADISNLSTAYFAVVISGNEPRLVLNTLKFS